MTIQEMNEIAEAHTILFGFPPSGKQEILEIKRKRDEYEKRIKQEDQELDPDKLAKLL